MVHSDIFLSILGIAIIFISLAIVLMGLGELVKWFSRKTEQHSSSDLKIGKRELHTIK